ncbi:hypothetical protein RchiOBHm_Chr2g0164261 [Rosa chinensis]|uniref:Uncharacterized protein n=1 Tax=Rosa chinensis TaxID=74649 RepID=A0A2P6S3J0_ROSCH|nr:hypothetical protein RchiOBHm_Chr2g0164261 [Rosa chinensis]
MPWGTVLVHKGIFSTCTPFLLVKVENSQEVDPCRLLPSSLHVGRHFLHQIASEASQG